MFILYQGVRAHDGVIRGVMTQLELEQAKVNHPSPGDPEKESPAGAFLLSGPIHAYKGRCGAI